MGKYPVGAEKELGLSKEMGRLGIDEQDIVEKFVRGSGPGGQKINKTASTVYLRHEPTGTEVKCQQTRSQALNRYYARKELCSKIGEQILGEQSAKRQASEKVRRQKRKRSKRQKEKMLNEKKTMGQKRKTAGVSMLIENRNQPILIVGSGYVGSYLAQQLVAAGNRVYTFNRSGKSGVEGAIALQGDSTKPETLAVLPDDVQAAVYAVAAGSHSDEAYKSAYVQGLTNIVEALRKRAPKLKRLLFTSSTSVYNQDEGEWIDEGSPAETEGFTGHRMREAEAVCLGSGYEAAVVRLSGVYGPERHRMIEEVRSGQAVCYPGEPRYSNRIHRDDCAGALQHLLFLPEIQKVYVGSDSEPADRSEILRWIARQLELPEPRVVTGSAEAGHKFGTNKRLSNRRLLASGYTFRYPTFRDGYSELIRS